MSDQTEKPTNVMSLSAYRLGRLIGRALDWVHSYETEELDASEDGEDMGPPMFCPSCNCPVWIVLQYGSICASCGAVTEEAFHCLEEETVDGE